MYHIVDVRVLVKHRIQLFLVRDVALVVLGPLSAYELDAVEDFVGRVVQVVDDDDFVVGFEECERGEGADVACAAAIAGLAWCSSLSRECAVRRS